MIINQTHSTELSSPIQRIFGRVELYNGSTLLKICNCGDVLESFTVDRVGEGKFFGFGVCHQLKTTIFDSNLELNLTKGIKCKVAFVVAENDVCYPFPDFYIEEVSRDEETDDLNITAYDKIYETSKHNFSELSISAPYTVRDAAVSVANFLGLTIHLENINSGDSSFDTLYADGANLKGTELIRDVLNAIAEVTQTIYFINYDNKLVFKRLNRDGEHLATVDRSNYENLSSKILYVLKDICSATELGDNVISESTLEGVTQYVRNNPFWELREDLGTLLDAAQNVVGGLSATEFDCSWFGNYLLEIGDKIKFIGRRDKTFYSFLLDDSITFNGDIQMTKAKQQLVLPLLVKSLIKHSLE